MKLIVDSGSTKADWALVTDGGELVRECRTQGISPVHQSDGEILHVMQEELTLSDSPAEVYFYGSGVTEAQKPRMEQLLSEAFPGAKVEAESDLLGAARALFGEGPGIACILGTGSNSCLYDGREIVQNTPPLGYILGDEGSGAYLGKRFLGELLKGELPQSLKKKFFDWAQLDYPSIINKVYREPMANRFLASLCPFISGVLEKENPDSEELDEADALGFMVEESFREFFDKNTNPYLEHLGEMEEEIPPFGFVGSVAWHFETQLYDSMEWMDCEVEEIVQSPLDGLIRFHANRAK